MQQQCTFIGILTEPITKALFKTLRVFQNRPEEYRKKVIDHVKKYATEEALKNKDEEAVSSSSESSMSEFSEDEAQVLVIYWKQSFELASSNSIFLCFQGMDL